MSKYEKQNGECIVTPIRGCIECSRDAGLDIGHYPSLS